MGLLSQSSRSGLLTRRGAALATVAALHVVGLVALARAHLHVDADPQPQLLRVDFLQQAPPSAPPPPRLQPTLTPQAVQLVMPRIDIPVVELSESNAIVATAAPVITSTVAAPVEPVANAQVDEPTMLTAEDVDYLRRPAPRYPDAARRARLQGTVLLWVLIDAEGHPREVRVHQSSGYPQLDREGCDAIQRALFKPYRHHGVPHSAQAIVPVAFQLNLSASNG